VNSTSLQALVAAFSAVNSSDTEQFAPLKSSHTQEPFLWHDKTMALSRRSRFGMTCEPLTDDLGAALLTWWREASRARTLAQQEKAQDLVESAADCGASLPVSLARYDPDTHSLKTAQCSLLEDLTGCSLTLPRWGTMRNGAVYQQAIVELGMREIGYGYWLTPKATDIGRGENQETFLKRMGDRSDKCASSLPAQVSNPKTWPTPCARDSKGARGNSTPRDSLDYAVERGLTKSKVYEFPPPTGKLNPNWVEWLMGWNIGQTDLKPLVTGKSHYALQQHSIS